MFPEWLSQLFLQRCLHLPRVPPLLARLLLGPVLATCSSSSARTPLAAHRGIPGGRLNPSRRQLLRSAKGAACGAEQTCGNKENNRPRRRRDPLAAAETADAAV